MKVTHFQDKWSLQILKSLPRNIFPLTPRRSQWPKKGKRASGAWMKAEPRKRKFRHADSKIKQLHWTRVESCKTDVIRFSSLRLKILFQCFWTWVEAYKRQEVKCYKVYQIYTNGCEKLMRVKSWITHCSVIFGGPCKYMQYFKSSTSCHSLLERERKGKGRG